MFKFLCSPNYRISLQLLNMQSHSQKSTSIFVKIRERYLQKLGLLNQEEEKSIYFVILIQTLRLLFGHSQIYCLTMMQNSTKPELKMEFFNKLGEYIKHGQTHFNQFCLIIVVSAIIFSLIALGTLNINERIQKKYRLMKIIYYLSHVMEVSHQLLYSIFAYVIYSEFKNGGSISLVFIIPGFLLSTFFFKMTSISQQRNNFETQDMYSHIHNYQVYGINSALCLMTFIGTLLLLIQIPPIYKTIIIVVWLLLQIFKIKKTVIEFFYDKSVVNYWYNLVICAQSSQMLLFTVYDWSSLQMIKENIFLLIIFMTVFLYSAAINYSIFLKQNSFFWQFDQLQSKQSLYLLFNSYFQALQGVKRQNNDQVYLVVSSLKKNHQNNCKDHSCYCRKEGEISIFMKDYVLAQLTKAELENERNKQVRMYLMNFKFHIYNLYSNIYEEISKYESSYELNFFEKLQIKSIRLQIKNWIKGEGRKEASLKIDNILRFEETMRQLNQYILQDITLKYRKWQILTKKICKIHEISETSNKQLQCLINIEKIKKENWTTFNRSLAFNSILYFYFKKIALRMNDLNGLQENIIELNRKIKQEQLNKPQAFIRQLFNKNSCTFQSSVSTSSIGTIFQVTKSALSVFGYDQQNLVGKNISCLIPKFLAIGHEQMMKQWIQKGGNFASSKISQVFCLHKENYIFKSCKYFKVYATMQKVCLITTFFKKSDIDYVLIDDRFQLQNYGKSFEDILSNIPRKILSDCVFKNMRRKIQNATQMVDKEAITIMYNEQIINKLYQKKKKQSFENKEGYEKKSEDKLNIPDFIEKNADGNQHSSKYAPLTTVQFDNIWKMYFKYRKEKLRDTFYYVIKAKSLEYIQYCDQQKSNYQKNIPDKLSELGDVQENKNEAPKLKIYEDIQQHQHEKSSMASYNTLLGYGVSKMITHFSEILYEPKKLTDKRSKRIMFVDIICFVVLNSIVLSCLILNRLSLDDKVTVLQAKSSIDKAFHLLQVTTNSVYNMYMYRKDISLQKLAVTQVQWDSNKFSDQITFHYNNYNKRFSPLKSGQLYKYLKNDLKWTFPKGTTPQIQLLEYFKMTYYVSSIIKEQLSRKFQNKTVDYTLTTEMFKLLEANLQSLRGIRDTLTVITESQLEQDERLNHTIYLASLCSFIVLSVMYAFITNNNRKFRYQQNQHQVNIYKMIDTEMLQTIKNYYFTYYNFFVSQKVRIDNHFINNEFVDFEYELEDIEEKEHSEFNRIKFLHHGKYLVWIGVILGLGLANAGNLVIVEDMYIFNKQISFFSKLSDSISQGESIVLNRLIRLKSTYYFDKPSLTPLFMDRMLALIQDAQISFNAYSTFEPDWIVSESSSFRQEFNQLLLSSPCKINKAELTEYQLQVCHKYSSISQNGIMTFVNGFSRLMRSTFLMWKKNLTSILKETDYLSTRTEFMEIDFGITFHVGTFNKLTQKLISVYQKGFLDQFKNCVFLFGAIFALSLLILIWSIGKYQSDRKTLSRLYGYVLLVPPKCVKKSKYLVKFLESNLEFQWEY